MFENAGTYGRGGLEMYMCHASCGMGERKNDLRQKCEGKGKFRTDKRDNVTIIETSKRWFETEKIGKMCVFGTDI